MSVLSFQSIKQEIELEHLLVRPFEIGNVQPASLDLRLAEDLHINHGEFKLASTLEWVKLPPNIRGEVHGRSSIGRLGLFVHVTAGYIDPGFRGTITLECYSVAPRRLDFKRGDRLCQIAFSWLDKPTFMPYNGRYNDQEGPTPSRFWEDAPR